MFLKIMASVLAVALIGASMPLLAEDSTATKPIDADMAPPISMDSSVPAAASTSESVTSNYLFNTHLSPNFLSPKTIPLMASLTPRFHFDGQDSSAGSNNNSSKGPWRTLGKVLFGVGLGMIAAGAAQLAYAQTIKDTSHSTYYYSYTEDQSLTRDVYRISGGADLAAGVVLMIVGLAKRH